MRHFYKIKTQFAVAICSLIMIGLSMNAKGQLPFSDGFESGNFTTGGWTVTGNAEISTQSPSQGTYCVKGPGTYRIEKSFTNLNENIITVEYVMKASQTGSNCCQFGCWDANNNESAVVFFRHTGNIEAKDGPTGSTSIALMPYVADTWYNMKIVLNFTNKTYDVYIDNVLKANDFGFYVPNYGSPQSFSWRSGETWGTGWIDEISITGSGSFGGIPFTDCFESGNFTTGGWTVTGNAEISTQSPSQGTYCVKGPGTYRIEKSFTNLNENIITVEYVMKASQTGSNCCQFGCWDANNNESAVVFFRHTGNIEAKDGPTGSTSIALMPYVADTWYNMKIVLNFTNKTYDVYIDNVLKANDFGFYVPNYGSPQSFSWRSGETWGTGWIDCVNIYAGTTGMNNGFGKAIFKIYPNPVSNLLNIKSNLQGTVQINIINSIGQNVYSGSIFDNKVISMNNFTKGIYFVLLKDKNGNLLMSEKIIKK